MVLCREASSAAQSSVGLLTETVSVDIRKPSSESDELPSKVGPATIKGIVENGPAGGDDELKLQAHTEAQEIIVAKVDDEQEATTDSEAAMVAPGSPVGRDGGVDVEGGEEAASYRTMVDESTSEVVSVKVLPTGKEFVAPSAFADVEADNFAVLGSAPWFEIDALAVEGFVDQYAMDGWLPGDIPLEWTWSLCWRHNIVSLCRWRFGGPS